MYIRDFSMIIRLKNKFACTVARRKKRDMKYDVKHSHRSIGIGICERDRAREELAPHEVG